MYYKQGSVIYSMKGVRRNFYILANELRSIHKCKTMSYALKCDEIATKLY